MQTFSPFHTESVILLSSQGYTEKVFSAYLRDEWYSESKKNTKQKQWGNKEDHNIIKNDDSPQDIA